MKVDHDPVTILVELVRAGGIGEESREMPWIAPGVEGLQPWSRSGLERLSGIFFNCSASDFAR